MSRSTLSRPAEAPRGSSRASWGQLARNSLSGVAAWALTMPLTLLVSAFVVHRIGVGPYGIYATLMGVVGFGSILDLGVRTPLIKYIAEYMALGREDELGYLLSTAMVLYFCIGMAFFLATLASASWVLPHLFHVAVSDRQMYALYLTVTGTYVILLTGSVLQSLIIGSQRADLYARVTFGQYAVNALATVGLLLLGFGVRGLTWAWVVSTLFTVGSNWVVARRLHPRLRLNPLLFRVARLKTLLHFSARVQVTTLTLTLNDQVDRALIAYVLGQTPLGYYALAQRVASALAGVSFNLMAGLLPAASDVAARGQHERLRALFLRSNRYVAIIDLGMCAAVAALAVPLVHAWLGAGYTRTALTLAVILAGYAVWLPSQVTSEVLNALGRPDIRMRADLAFLCLHIPLCALLIWRFGYYGTLTGTAASLSLTRLYLYIRGAAVVGVGVRGLAESMAHPAMGAGLSAACALLPQALGLPISLPSLGLEGSLFGAIWVVYTAVFSLTAAERARIGDLLGRVLRRGTSAA